MNDDVLQPWLWIPVPDLTHPDVWRNLPDGVKAHTAARTAAAYRAVVAVADRIAGLLDEDELRAFHDPDGVVEVWATTRHAYLEARKQAAAAAQAWDALATGRFG